MNKVILSGRFTKDPELKTTASQIQFTNFTLAVDRRFKDANGQRQADFINCTAWRQTATFISQYFRKGSKIAVVGSLSTRSYQDESGNNRYVTEVVIEEAEFAEAKMAEKAPTKPTTPAEVPEYTTDDIADDTPLPFEV